MRAVVSVILGALVAIVVTGCGDQPQEPTARLHGTVTVNGKPLAFGEVQIVAENREPLSAALDESGNYDIPDAPVGPVKVAIVTPKRPVNVQGARDRLPEAMKKSAAGRNDSGAPEVVYRIPDSYRSHTQSGLSVTVSPDGTTVLDIAIAVR